MVPTRGRRSSGFTILELLILMVVLGIAASVGIPSYFSRPDVTLKNAAELLANDLREVGGRAAVYRRSSVRFDEDGGGYSATDWSGQLSSLRTAPAPSSAATTRRVFRGVTIEALQPEAPRSVTFDATGTASHSIAVTSATVERPAWSRSPRAPGSSPSTKARPLTSARAHVEAARTQAFQAARPPRTA